MALMIEGVPFHSKPRVDRLAIVESDALDDRIPLLISSNQWLFAQGAEEGVKEFSLRFVERVAGLPPAHLGLLMLGDNADFDSRWRNLLALASRVQGADMPELIINVRSGSASESIGWELLDRASQEAFFRGIHMSLQFSAPRSEVRARPLSRTSAPLPHDLSPLTA